MKRNHQSHLGLALMTVLAVFETQAQLLVTVTSPTVVGQKTVVQLGQRNTSGERIESARAAVFLLDDQGKMVGQATKWVIGGSQDNPGLAAGATNVFHFVITTDKPLPKTNVTAKVIFNRIVLEGGRLAGAKDVQIQPAKN